MGGWHHQLNDDEFEQTPGDSQGLGSQVCCSPWGRKEAQLSDRTTTTVLTSVRIVLICMSLVISNINFLFM